MLQLKPMRKLLCFCMLFYKHVINPFSLFVFLSELKKWLWWRWMMMMGRKKVKVFYLKTLFRFLTSLVSEWKKMLICFLNFSYSFLSFFLFGGNEQKSQCRIPIRTFNIDTKLFVRLRFIHWIIGSDCTVAVVKIEVAVAVLRKLKFFFENGQFS